MRIVHVADSFAPDVGGIESQVMALAHQQLADGHHVEVITAVNKPDNGDDADFPFAVHRGLRTRVLTICFPFLNHRMVARALDAQPRPDVVHAHFTVISPIAIYTVRAASRRGIPVAITVHSVWWRWAFAVRGSFVPFFGPARMRATWSGVSRMIASMVDRTLPRVDEVYVVPNLVDVDWWRDDGPAPAPHTHPQPHPDLRLTLVGRLKRRKQIDKFIDLVAQVKARVSEDTRMQVEIVGDGPRREQLQQQIDRLDLGDWVRLIGGRTPEQIRDLLHDSDLFVAPCTMEAFGIAALEARGAGLPVLGYGHTGIADFIEDGVEGYLVKDDAELVDRLVQILGDRSGLCAIRRTTRARRPTVTMDRAIDATYSFYEQAIARRRPGRTGARAEGAAAPSPGYRSR